MTRHRARTPHVEGKGSGHVPPLLQQRPLHHPERAVCRPWGGMGHTGTKERTWAAGPDRKTQMRLGARGTGWIRTVGSRTPTKGSCAGGAEGHGSPAPQGARHQAAGGGSFLARKTSACALGGSGGSVVASACSELACMPGGSSAGSQLTLLPAVQAPGCRQVDEVTETNRNRLLDNSWSPRL